MLPCFCKSHNWKTGEPAFAFLFANPQDPDLSMLTQAITYEERRQDIESMDRGKHRCTWNSQEHPKARRKSLC